MNFLITGGTGFIGKHLTAKLITKGHHVFVVTRSPQSHKDTKHVTYLSYQDDVQDFPAIYGVINLAGESLFGYWTEEKKKKIRQSRIEATKNLIELVSKLNEKPKVFINGSAVGYYGTSTEIIFTENTEKPGKDFLSSVVVDWEETAKTIEKMGIRTIYARFGIILGRKEGSFPLMALPVKLFVGGSIGDGEQWISWIHIDDAVNLLEFCIFNERMQGPVNVTATEPKRNKDFYRLMAKSYNRPYWFPAPKLFIKLAMGEMSTLITEGQFAYPKQAEDNGFSFQYPKLVHALNDLI